MKAALKEERPSSFHILLFQHFTHQTGVFHKLSNTYSSSHERDLALLLQLREGNEQAFNTIVTLYLEPLYRFAYIRTQDSNSLTISIAQDVLVQLWKHQEQLNPAQSHPQHSSTRAILTTCRAFSN
jgi:hypothetical protein